MTYDELGINADADALAAIIASRSVSPPLSVGIFGQEGSGRSFLAYKVRHKIRMISEHAEANHLQRDVAYCSPIVQVEYNAWHNAGTNPWIGLVESIFTAIDQWAKEAGFATDVFLQLGTARRLLREYDAKVKARQAVLSQAQEAFAGAEKQFQAAIDRHARALSASKWQAVAAKLGPDWKDNKARDRAGRTLGIEAISLKPELHDKVLKESKTLSGRAGLLSDSLKTRKFLGNALVVVFFVLLVSIGTYFGLSQYATSETLKDALELIKNELAIVTSVIAILGAVTGLYLRNQINEAIDFLLEDEAKLYEKIQAVEQEMAIETALAQNQVNACQKELESRRTGLVEAEREFSVASQAFEDFLKDDVLRSIIEYYRMQILSDIGELQPGFAPAIGDDFSDLSAILAALRESYESSSQEEKPPVQRVVIFIDDLDQCQPQTAIAVVQAVHLLLSFPLFAVVFVVNPLWLLRMLAPRYPALLEAETEAGRDELRSLSEVEYLSKLIQIPFWVRPMDRKTVEELVRWRVMPQIVKPPAPAALAKEDTIASFSPDESPRPIPEFPVGDPFRMTEEEAEFIAKIAVLITRFPRHVNRLISGYTLLRSLQSRKDASDLHGSFEPLPDYPIAISLLAIVISAPDTAPAFFNSLEKKFQDPHSLLQPLGLFDIDLGITKSKDGPLIQAILEALVAASYGRLTGDALLKWSREVALHSYNIPPAVF